MQVCVDRTTSMHSTICEWFKYHSPQTKICWFFARAQREFCTLCGKVSSCLRTARLLPTFFAFFQYGLINVCWVRTETMVRLTFKENWFTVHLVRIVCKPHNVIDVQCVPNFVLYLHTCFFTFIKHIYHSTSSNASDTYVAAYLIGVVFTFIEGMCRSTSGYTIDVHIQAFLCSSKAYFMAQVAMSVTHMSLDLNEVDEHSAWMWTGIVCV